MNAILKFFPHRMVRFYKMPYWGILVWTIFGVVALSLIEKNGVPNVTTNVKESNQILDSVPTAGASSIQAEEPGKYVLVLAGEKVGKLKLVRLTSGVEILKHYSLSGELLEKIKIHSDKFSVYDANNLRVAKGKLKNGRYILRDLNKSSLPYSQLGASTIRQAALAALNVGVPLKFVLIHQDQAARLSFLPSNEIDDEPANVDSE